MQSGGIIKFTCPRTHINYPMLGTTHTNTKNAIDNIVKRPSQVLELIGVGYKASFENNILGLSLAYSHTVYVQLPKDVEVEIKGTVITITADDVEILGKIVSTIKKYRIPENYKGKGIRKEGEYVLIKEVKKK